MKSFRKLQESVNKVDEKLKNKDHFGFLDIFELILRQFFLLNCNYFSLNPTGQQVVVVASNVLIYKAYQKFYKVAGKRKNFKVIALSLFVVLQGSSLGQQEKSETFYKYITLTTKFTSVGFFL